MPGAARYPRILTYHEISSRFHLGVNCVSPQTFRSHLEFLRQTELSIVKLRGLSNSNTANTVTLTFDDGYSSFYDEVLPALVENRIPATLFVITEYVGRNNDWDVTFGINRRRHLDWEKIKEISNYGIEIGSHSRTHRDLTRLATADLHRELTDSKKILEDKTGLEITSLALPFGAATLDVFIEARTLGYREICGCVPGFYGPLPGILPRMPVYRGDTIRTLRRKLEFNPREILRLRLLHACSMGTRLLKG